jgi:hypothetical protein
MTNKASKPPVTGKVVDFPLVTERQSQVPFAFECPLCEHFPMVKIRNQRDVFSCNRCDRVFILVDGLWGLRFMEDRGKKGIMDYSACAFERVPGKTRLRGPKCFS